MTWTATSAGVVAEPENLYNNVTRSVFNTVDGFLPANRAEVKEIKAEFEAYKAVSKAQFKEYTAKSEAFETYENKTAALVNALVVEVNSLTPVGRLPENTSMRVDFGRKHFSRRAMCFHSMQGYNGTNGLNGFNGTNGTHP